MRGSSGGAAGQRKVSTPRRVTPVVDPEPFPDDELLWDDQFEVEQPTPPPPRTPSPAEHLYLDILIAGGMLHARWGLPRSGGLSRTWTLSSMSPSNASRCEKAS